MLAGGNDSENKCEMLDCVRNEWKQLPDLNIGRTNCSASAFDNNIVYVFCGHGQSKDLNTIERWAVGDSGWGIVKTNTNDMGY